MILCRTMERNFLRRAILAGGLLSLTALGQGCESSEAHPPPISIARSSPTAEGGPTPLPTPTARLAIEGSEGTSNPQIRPTINIPATVAARATTEETRKQAALTRSTLIPSPNLEQTPAVRSTVSGSTPIPSR